MFLLAGELCRAVLEQGWASRSYPKGPVVPSWCCRRGLWVGSALHQVDAAHSSAQNCSCSLCSCASWVGWEEQTERTSPVFSSLPRYPAVAAAVVCPATVSAAAALSDSRAAGRAHGVWFWDRQHLGLDPACRCLQESKEAVRFKVTGRNPSLSSGSLVRSLGEPVSPLG